MYGTTTKLSGLRYADDIDLIEVSAEAFQHNIYVDPVRSVQSFGFEINVIKTKAMCMGTEADPDAEIRIQHEEVQ